jgi:hypothetical protein
MGLLTPLYLIGLAALSLPIVFHLLRKSIRKELSFSSLIFLRQNPPRLTRRSRIENWWLLLLRAAILTLLVFAFTRPLFRTQQTTQSTMATGRDVVYLVDQSASMQRGVLWQQAMEQLRKLSDNSTDRDRQSLFVYDQTAKVVVDGQTSIDEIPPAEAIRLWSSKSQPGWNIDDLPSSMQACLDWITTGTSETESRDRLESRPIQIHIISDFQSPASNAWNQIQWPQGATVAMHHITREPTDNASLMLLQPSEEYQWDANQVSVRLTNNRTSKSTVLTLSDDAGRKLEEILLPAGQSRVLSIEPEADPTQPWRLDLGGDQESFDNQLFLPPVASQSVSVAVTGNLGDSGETSSWMLEQACQSLKYQKVNWQEVDRLEGIDLNPFHALFVLRPLATDELVSVRTFLTQGGRVIVALTESIAAGTETAWQDTLCQLGQWTECKVSEATVKDFSLVSSIDTTRPPLDLFRSSTFRDFTSIYFWHHRICEIQDTATKILASFDDGAPFLIQKAIDSGELFVFTGGWTPQQSQLGQNSRFATLMIQISGLRQLRPPIDFIEIGESLVLEEPTTQTVAQLFDEQGLELATSADQSSYLIDQPGLYRIRRDERDSFVIAQIPSEEREDARTEPKDLEGMGIPGGDDEQLSKMEKREERLKDEQLESQQQAWRWLLVGVIVLVIGETFASGWMSRGRIS